MQEKTIFTEKGIIIGEKNNDVFVVKILSGDEKGKIVNVFGEKEEFQVGVYDFKKGDKIALYIEKYPDEHFENYSIQGYRHVDSLIIWFFIFCGIVILIGKKQGLMSLLSLFGGVAMILFLLIPGIKNGYNPVILTGLISFFTTVFTILLITGNSKKSWIAIFGTIFGVVCAYIFAFLIAKTSGINGLGSEDARSFAILNVGFDYFGIFFAGIIIGALGAVMDTTISIASGLNEVKEKTGNIGFKGLLKSGMIIGGDVMGGMINTLVFAYLGTSLVVILSASINGIGVLEFLNLNFISEEILRSISGTAGLVLSIPLTALIGAFVFSRRN
ncbi:YibE/F family protein [Candidatus Gracilibacteria bacterium]|nr:YibE/F family protein [Candidatus Gracilibacteria bacterium]